LHKTVAMALVDMRLRLVRPALAAALIALPLAVATAQTQTSPRPPGEVPFINFPPALGTPPARGTAADTPPTQAAPKVDELSKRDRELQAIRSEQKKAREQETRLRREVETIGEDRRKLNRQLIDVAARVRNFEQQVAATEERLPPLDEKERNLRASLDSRREVVAGVLAALQRIGRQPPPVLMVTPDDALKSVRSAMLLGAVLPEMRRDAEALMADLSELARVRKDIAAERAGLEKNLASLAEDRSRLTALTEQRQQQQQQVEQTLTAERQRAAQLARQATDMQELIAQLEQELDRSGRAARVAARTDDKNVLSDRPDFAALKDPGRLAPAVAFTRAKRMLPLPVNGVRIREFGAQDGLGGQEKGLSLATRAGAQITAPCDGWVVYAGPFRNYGQLLILNAGDGYHVLLAGMERISVDLGQFVVTGEPVAVMGGRVQTPAAIAIGSGQPVLYVEFRKDGTPIDPGPWWAASDSEKVRG
jgi:septal ring factor EnvC (AmiA/AmiB activator)